MNRRVLGQLRMKRRRQHLILPHQYGPTLGLGEHLDAAAHPLDQRSTDKNHFQRGLFQFRGAPEDLAGHLAPISISRDADVGESQRRLWRILHLARQQNSARARPKQRATAPRELPDGVEQTPFGEEFQVRAALAAGEHEPLQIRQAGGSSHKDVLHTQPGKHLAVRFKIARRDGRIVNAVPEFDDCARLAAANNLSVKEVQALAVKAYQP